MIEQLKEYELLELTQKVINNDIQNVRMLDVYPQSVMLECYKEVEYEY